MDIAFLGIGLMGKPMPIRLPQHGHAVRAWSRTRANAEALVPYSATVAATAAQAVAKAAVTITMLENGDALEQAQMSDSTLQGLSSVSLVIDMSSIAPQQAKDHAVRLARIGIRYLDAPVSGGTGGAEAGTLAIMAGGDESDIARAETIRSISLTNPRTSEPTS